MSGFSVKKFQSHSAENFCREILYCLIIFGYRKSLDKRERGVSRFSVGNFLSHRAEKIRRRINYCCSFFGYRKSLDKKRGVSNFPSKIFCFTVPKIFLGESFSVSLFSGIEKFCALEG